MTTVKWNRTIRKSASPTTLPYLLTDWLCVRQQHCVTYNINTCILLWSAVFRHTAFRKWSIILGELGGNILVRTNCFDITMAQKTSCKDVATSVGRFALQYILCLGRGNCPFAPTNGAPDLTSRLSCFRLLHFKYLLLLYEMWQF